MKDSRSIRETVSRAYAHALHRPRAGPQSMPKGTLACDAGYAPEQLAELPIEAVVSSFGCGNPLAYSEVMPGQTVLDLGCGAGIDLVLAARKVGPAGRAIGVDMTDAMVAKARSIIAQAKLTNAEVRKGLIEKLPVESASVDWVISNCVINLSPEKPRVFSEIARVLKPGGRILISDIVAEDLPQGVRENLALYSCCVAGALSERQYRDGLMQAGLVDFAVRGKVELELGQLEAVLKSDQEAFQSGPCCGQACDAELSEAGRLAAECKGKVWSVQISARKAD